MGSGERWETMLAGAWRSFDSETQRQLSEAKASGNNLHTFSARGWNYTVDFTRMVQINLSTGRERPVRCLSKKPAERKVPTTWDQEESQHRVYSMLRCRVCLGNPYLIEGNLLKGDALHNQCWCQNPEDTLDSSAEAWCVAKGHDAYYVKGLSGMQKNGLGVYNSEYILFQPYQILPLYQVDYVVE